MVLLYVWWLTDNQLVLAPHPWDSRSEIYLLQLNLCSHSPYATCSLKTGWVCLMNRLLHCQVYVSCIQRVTGNSYFRTTCESPVSSGLGKLFIPVLLILCYNSSLITWMVQAWPRPNSSFLYILCVTSVYPVLPTLLFSWTASGFLSGSIGTTIKQNT
jgi:hypothetical protein